MHRKFEIVCGDIPTSLSTEINMLAEEKRECSFDVDNPFEWGRSVCALVSWENPCYKEYED